VSLDVIHESTAAPTANRFATPGGTTLVLAANGGMAQAAYIASRWRILG
jgi:hypothetical protein